MERAAAIEATGAPPNKRTLTGGTKRIQKIECNVLRLPISSECNALKVTFVQHQKGLKKIIKTPLFDKLIKVNKP